MIASWSLLVVWMFVVMSPTYYFPNVKYGVVVECFA